MKGGHKNGIVWFLTHCFLWLSWLPIQNKKLAHYNKKREKICCHCHQLVFLSNADMPTSHHLDRAGKFYNTDLLNCISKPVWCTCQDCVSKCGEAQDRPAVPEITHVSRVPLQCAGNAQGGLNRSVWSPGSRSAEVYGSYSIRKPSHQRLEKHEIAS